MRLQLTQDELAQFFDAIGLPESAAHVRALQGPSKRPPEPGWYQAADESTDFRDPTVRAYIAISERYAAEYAQVYPELASEVAMIRADVEGTLKRVGPLVRASFI